MPKLVRANRDDLPQLEADVLRECRQWLALQTDITIHRNNTGVAHVSREDFIRGGLDVHAAEVAARVVRTKFHGMHFGLSIGSSDLIGTIRIAGRAVFLAIELKRPGKRPTEDQERFLASKREAGAVAFWADSLDTVKREIAAARASL